MYMAPKFNPHSLVAALVGRQVLGQEEVRVGVKVDEHVARDGDALRPRGAQNAPERLVVVLVDVDGDLLPVGTPLHGAVVQFHRVTCQLTHLSDFSAILSCPSGCVVSSFLNSHFSQPSDVFCDTNNN